MNRQDFQDFDSSRLWARVDKTNDCWLWLGTLSSNGGGQLKVGGKTRLAHLVAWSLINGDIPDRGLRRKCANKTCVNPSHYIPKVDTDLFWEKVNKNGPIIREEFGNCWVWTGAFADFGYGRLSWHSEQIRAHRLSWILEFHSIPDGMNVLHKCDNPPCVRPSHLFLGTIADNSHDMIKKGRDHSCCQPGSLHAKAKLDETDVVKIRLLRDAGIRVAQIAEQFHVTRGMVHNIVARRNWRHVK